MNRCHATQWGFGLMLLAVSALSACNSAAPAPSDSAGDTPAPSASAAAGGGDRGGTVVVLAAASMTTSLADIEKDYEAEHPGVDVQVSTASSTTIVEQVNSGAPADILITAGQQALNTLSGQWHEADARSIASNQLTIATPPKNPAKIDSVTDLSKPDVDVVLCAATAPCGRAADELLVRAGVTANVVSRELDARATLAKVKLGEVDAAIVYASDVASARSSVHGVAIPSQLNVAIEYPALNLTGTPQADDFEAYLRGAAAGWTLAADGFGRPGTGTA